MQTHRIGSTAVDGSSTGSVVAAREYDKAGDVFGTNTGACAAADDRLGEVGGLVGGCASA